MSGSTTRSSLFWPTAFTVLVLAALLSLGTWQVKRLHWKEGLIAQRAAAVNAVPIDPPRSLEDALPLEFHAVHATGIFLHDHEFLVHGIERASGDGGYLVVTPLALPDGTILLVERGWVPDERKAPESRAAGQPAGTVTIDGLLRLPFDGKPGAFIPDNQPATNEWYYIDVGAMARALGAQSNAALPYYIDAGPAPNPGGFPLGGQTITELRNDHLQYAITWYALAAALVVMYGIFVMRQRASSKATSSS